MIYTVASSNTICWFRHDQAFRHVGADTVRLVDTLERKKYKMHNQKIRKNKKEERNDNM